MRRGLVIETELDVLVMAGFLLNLKKTRNDGYKQNGLSVKKVELGAKKKVATKKVGLFQESDESDDEGKITSIDGFDTKKGGAMVGDIAIGEKKTAPLVIVPANLRKGIKRSLPNQHSQEDLERKIIEEKNGKLQYGITYFDKPKIEEKVVVADNITEDDDIRQSLVNDELQDNSSKLIINVEDNFQQTIDDAPDEDSDEEYKKVPVDQFGAAMLRGMGWKPSANSKIAKSTILDHRKKGQLLGIGAKPLDSDLIDDIMGKKGDKIEVPLEKKVRKS